MSPGPRLAPPIRRARCGWRLRLLAPVSDQHLPDKFGAQIERALTEYTSAQQVNAERPEAHLNLGLIAVAPRKPLQAEQAYQTAIRLDKTFTPAYANLADLYRQYQRDSDGEKVLRQGITAVPDDASLYYALGLLQVRKERMAEALQSLRRATELEPESRHSTAMSMPWGCSAKASWPRLRLNWKTFWHAMP
jgi:tetratricopeptide (TPR) repeat protein